MSGVNYNAGFAPIDPSGIRLQGAHDPLGHNTGFDKVLNQVGTGLSMFGPAISTGLNFGGFTKGSAIASAAIMGFGGASGFSTPGMSPMMGGMSGGMAPKAMGGGNPVSWGPAPGVSPKALGGGIPLGDAPGYPGGGGGGMPGAAPGFPGGGGGMMGAGGVQDGAQFDGQINAMFNQNMVFLALQTKVQNVAQITQATSNIAKVDSDARLNAIRNFRA